MTPKQKNNIGFSETWNLRFMQIAKLIAQWSKDESTKVGCVVVGPDREIRSTGYNGFPRGVNDDIAYRKIRPQKYDFTEHAERNAIYNATLTETSLKNCVAYVTLPPCVECARGIIQSGIREVIYLDMPHDKAQKIPGWRDKLAVSFEMFDEANVRYKALNPVQKPFTQNDINKALKLFDDPKLYKFANDMIRINGKQYQSFICVEEINELVKELALNNSADNIAEETADYIITRNHVVCAYNLGNGVIVARDKKILTPDFMMDEKAQIIALLDFQKTLTKYVNRNAATLDDLTNRIAEADLATLYQILSTESLPKIKQVIDQKVKRTLQKVKGR